MQLIVSHVNTANLLSISALKNNFEGNTFNQETHKYILQSNI